jgi:drug/metabolite transporter (DMT)-like permease
MPLSWMAVVLFAAVLHATWNAVIKSSGDKFHDTVLVTLGSAAAGALLLPWVPLPAPASRPYLIASVTIHIGYFSLVALAYRLSDMSYIYPLMRGVAPLLTALAASVAIAEPLTPGGKIGIMLLSSGILLLTSDAWWSRKVGAQPTAVGLLNAFVIAMYTVIDGIGLRLSGNPWSYVSWFFLFQPVPFIAFFILSRRHSFLGHVKQRWRVGTLVGLCTFTSYGLALYAMAYIPIALVAALRETSVIFGAAIAAIFLGERFGPIRYLAALLVTAGAAAMKIL